MKIVVDESVSYSVATWLRSEGYEVLAIADTATTGLKDMQVFQLVKNEKAVFITRDHHFTNNLRFPVMKTHGIIFIRKGNLTSQEEVDLIKWFWGTNPFAKIQGHLVTISRNYIKIR